MRTPALKIFSIVYGIVYFVAFYVDLALFRYYPDPREFHWRQDPNAGPAILWYGWLVSAGLISAAIAAVVPRKWAERVPYSVVWMIPVLTVIGILFYEKRWFI